MIKKISWWQIVALVVIIGGTVLIIWSADQQEENGAQRAPVCPHPKCKARMIRAYVRDGGEVSQFRPVGWWCIEC